MDEINKDLEFWNSQFKKGNHEDINKYIGLMIELVQAKKDAILDGRKWDIEYINQIQEREIK